MEFKNTLEIVTKDIQDIEKLVSNFKNYSRIPNIELDLALSRLRNVYDLLLMFREEPVRPVLSPPAETPVQEVKIAPAEATANVAQKTEVQTPVNPPADTMNIAKEAKPAPAMESPKPSTEKKPSGEKIFINEKLGSQKAQKDISSRLQEQSIKSIAGSIGINDKFFFIRELFGGNADTFRQTMSDLDGSHNFNDAFSLLNDRFQWDMDSEPVQMLLNLIRRKFISSGNE